MTSVAQVKSPGCLSCIPTTNIFRRIRKSCKTYPDITETMEPTTSTSGSEKTEVVVSCGSSKVRHPSFSLPMPVAVPSLLTDASSSSAQGSDDKSQCSVKIPSQFGSKELIVLKTKNNEMFAKQRFTTRLNYVKDVREDREGVRLAMAAPAQTRKYIPLKPGRSLMDWIRLSNNSPDLSGFNGKRFDVSEEELAKHNSVNDAWICLKGKVYNITAYLEYHPGGIDILMSTAVGKDATEIFLQTHKWVNFETMLEKCFVGRLVTISAPLAIFEQKSKEIQKRRKLQFLSQTANFLSPNDMPKPSSIIRCDWYQSETSVIIVIYTNFPNIKQEDVIIDKKINEEIIITLYLNDFVFYYHIELHQPVQETYEIKIGFNGKIEIILHKMSPSKWVTVGSPLKLHNHRIAIDQKEFNSRECYLLSKSSLTPNINMFSFELPKTSRMCTPAAKHVVLTLADSEKKISRTYTPVPKYIFETEPDEHIINLIIKIYENGSFTTHLNRLEIGSTILISDYFGQFSLEKLNNISHFIGIVGGTGITPILSILHYGIIRKYFRYEQIKVLYFVQTEKDIIWKNQLEQINENYSNCEIKFIVANPTTEWQGVTGFVTKNLLHEFVPMTGAVQKLICICGPTNFNTDCVRYLNQIGVCDYEVFVFSNEQYLLSS